MMDKRIRNGIKRIFDGPTVPLRLLVGLNRVDEIVPGGWDTRLNLPTADAALQIQRKCADLSRLLMRETRISESHIEYYSALKRYRLHDLLNRVIINCDRGFRLGDVNPKDFEDVEGVDPEVRRFTKEERERRAAAIPGGKMSVGERLFTEIGRFVNADDLETVKGRFAAEMKRPPRVAVLGQSGVGKTTTVNALFATDWQTSAVEVGTHEVQDKTVGLPSGATIEIVDLPGYGRSLREDERYEQIYRDVIPGCDLVMLIIQADRGDLVDDQEMIRTLKRLMTNAPADGQ
jgi:predicted GTPase